MYPHRECFNTYFVHRFRATFGKVRLFTAGEKVYTVVYRHTYCVQHQVHTNFTGVASILWWNEFQSSPRPGRRGHIHYRLARVTERLSVIQGLKLTVYKKLRFEPTVVIIDGEAQSRGL